MQYSLDGATYVDIATVSFSSFAAAGASIPSIDISAISALQNVPSTTTITFRIVPYGGTNTAGTFYIFDVANSTANDFAVNGNIVPVNDDCANAITLIPGATTACVPTTGTTVGATQSLPAITCGFTGTADDDVWFKFVATKARHAIHVTGGPGFDAVVDIYRACNGISIACADLMGVFGTETIALLQSMWVTSTGLGCIHLVHWLRTRVHSRSV